VFTAFYKRITCDYTTTVLLVVRFSRYTTYTQTRKETAMIVCRLLTSAILELCLTNTLFRSSASS